MRSNVRVDVDKQETLIQPAGIVSTIATTDLSPFHPPRLSPFSLRRPL